MFPAVTATARPGSDPIAVFPRLVCQLHWRLTVQLSLVWQLLGCLFQGTEPWSHLAKSVLTKGYSFFSSWKNIIALGSLHFSAVCASKA